MKESPPDLHTPIYLKLSEDMPWPPDAVFHLLSRDGLFRCRNHPFFRSSVESADFPSELAGHAPFVSLSYPKLSQKLFETVVGYFSEVADLHGAEAAVLLVWNRLRGEVEVVVPEQRSVVSISWFSGTVSPLNVHYEIPPLAAHQVPIGDVHSHVDGAAYASGTDVDDELHRPGLHIVVGRISREPPEFHVEVTVDGGRFAVENIRKVVEGYAQRRCEEVPEEWMGKLQVEQWKNQYWSAASTATASGYDDQESH